MRLLHSRNSWFFSQDFSREIDFCIWVLEIDGLQVPPFDQHADGDGLLRAAGLDGESWQAWLVRVVELQYQQNQALQRLPRDRPPTPQDWNAALIPAAREPAMALTGNINVREQLAGLWELYQPLADKRQKAEQKQSRKRSQLEVEQKINLWQDLKPYHARIPTLNIYMVYYDQPLNYLIPPVTLLTTFSDGQPDLAAFRERLLDGAAGLSAKTARQRAQSGYIQSLYMPPDQPVPLYKTYARQLIPVLTYPKVHIVVEDKLKQIVLDNLESHDDHYGDVDMKSVRFLKEKAIPGWQLYYVAFDEFDGHKHTNVVLLARTKDEVWRLKSFGSVTEARDIVTQLGIKIHDHPLLFLSGGTSFGRAARDEEEAYTFTAQGEVIDNGFEVTKVRLVSKDGESFEDMVQDGLVLFASIQDHEVKWPMQAELYNKDGKLVWRETVFDHVPPHWLKFRK